MLEAGGIPVVGTFPAFEDVCLLRKQVAADVCARFAGQAVKWLMPFPTNACFNEPAARIIYLTRDTKEQARSQLKLLGEGANRSKVRAMAASIKQDDRRAVAQLSSVGHVLAITFEEMISDPVKTSWAMAQFLDDLAADGEFNCAAAQRVVRKRGPYCLPDMALEASLLGAL